MWLEMLVDDFRLPLDPVTRGSGRQETWNLVLAQEHGLRDDYGLIHVSLLEFTLKS